jgi:hypothetical protein
MTEGREGWSGGFAVAVGRTVAASSLLKFLLSSLSSLSTERDGTFMDHSYVGGPPVCVCANLSFHAETGRSSFDPSLATDHQRAPCKFCGPYETKKYVARGLARPFRIIPIFGSLPLPTAAQNFTFDQSTCQRGRIFARSPFRGLSNRPVDSMAEPVGRAATNKDGAAAVSAIGMGWAVARDCPARHGYGIGTVWPLEKRRCSHKSKTVDRARVILK